jgi:hypothetical protein
LRIPAGGVTLWAVDFYFDAAAIGLALSAAWIAWLFAVRATLRKYRLKPGFVMTILQIGLVLLLIAAGFSASDYCLDRLGMHTPANVIYFRRIWIVIWAIAMLASIKIFLDIRQMAEALPPRAPADRPAPRSARRRQTRR